MPGELPLRRLSVGGIVWSSSRGVLQGGAQLLTLIVLARLLSPHDFGVAGAAVTVLLLGQVVCDMGIGASVIKQRDMTGGIAAAAATFCTLSGLMWTAALCLLASEIAQFLRIPDLVDVIPLYAASLSLYASAVVPRALIERDFRFRTLAKIEFSAYILGYSTTGVLLGVLGYGYYSIAVGHLLQNVLHAICMIWASRSQMAGGGRLVLTAEMLSFGAGNTLTKLANYGANQMDNILVGRVLGPTALGEYGRAYQLTVMPANIVGTAIDRVLFPAFARAHDRQASLREPYLQAVGLTALVAFPLGLFFALMSADIVVLLLGPQWDRLTIVLSIVSLGVPLRMGSKVCDSIARGTGKAYARFWRQLVFGVAVSIGAWTGLRWGLAGVAFCVLFALFMNYLFSLHLCNSVTRCGWRDATCAHRQGFVLALFLGALLLPASAAFESSFVGSVLSLLAGAATVGTSLALAVVYRWKWLLGRDGLWFADAILRTSGRPGRTR